MNNLIVFYDGLCNFCNSSVQFIIKHDKHKKFTFASLQSETAKQHIPATYLSLPNPDTFILIDNGILYERSTAALRLALHLGGFFKCLFVFIIVPRFIRDWLYNLFAKHRYTLFGKRDSCMVPSTELRDRFLK
jgi:predicted DCC family thiol-disulfide oxidoreductase YuxK